MKTSRSVHTTWNISVSGGEPILQQPPSWPPGLCLKPCPWHMNLFVSVYLLCAQNRNAKWHTVTGRGKVYS